MAYALDAAEGTAREVGRWTGPEDLVASALGTPLLLPVGAVLISWGTAGVLSWAPAGSEESTWRVRGQEGSVLGGVAWLEDPLRPDP